MKRPRPASRSRWCPSTARSARSPSLRDVRAVRDDLRIAAEPDRADPVKTIVQIAGLLAAVLGLLYAVGGGVLALRLYFEGLPSLTVVGQLPREFLVSLALTQVALPTAAVAALYLILRLLAGLGPPKRLVAARASRKRRDWRRMLGAAAAIAMVETLIGVLPDLQLELEWFHAWALLGFVLATIVVLVALELRTRAVWRYTRDWNSWRATGAMTGVIALASVPAWLLSAGTFHFLDAKVCLDGGAEERGVFVGETSSRVYLGEKANGGPHRIVSIPLAQIGEVFIGGESAERSCAVAASSE